MPQRSKKPIKKAAARSKQAPTSTVRSAGRAAPRAGKRSAARPATAKAKTKVRPALAAQQARGRAAKPKAKARSAAPRRVEKPAPRKATARKAAPRAKSVATPPPVTPRVAAATAHVPRSLILPPKPNKPPSRRLTVAPAPRAPRAVELSAEIPRPRTLRKAEAPREPASEPSAVAIRERRPRARITAETWRQAEATRARLGHLPLNDLQRVAIRASLEGQDSLVVLPSDELAVACYQVASQLLLDPSVVLSPVQAELRMQYEALTQRKVPAVWLSAELSGPERGSALTRISRGGSLLVLLTPEALRAPDVRRALAQSGIALFVVEEAHCASALSHELRPSYAELAQTLEAFGSPPVMAVTRIAKQAVRTEICERLALRAPVTVQAPAVRSNVQIVTKLARGEGRQASLVRLIERLELPGLIYCATPHDVDSVYSALRGAGIAAHRQHGGMTAGDRAAEVLGFLVPGQRSVMVAVSAFAPGSGLPGIGDSGEAFGRAPIRRDLRFVVHYQSPASIEQYLREIQVAGADGLPAVCVMLHESSHRSLHEAMLSQLRFRAVHLAELGRALETPALEARAVTLEALALGTGQSRRTTDRLTVLLADAGVIERTSGWVRVLCSASELDEACRRIGAQLYALREQDARRLASVSALAESSECKLSCLSQYLGDGPSAPCERCNACVSELFSSSHESLAPSASQRRAVVQEFSVQQLSTPSGVAAGGARSNAVPLTAPLADFSDSHAT